MGETRGMGIGSGNRRRSIKVVGAWEPLLLVAALLSISVLSGCAGVVNASKSGDPGTALIQLNPTTVSFGNIGVGKLSSQTLTIANTGTASVNITQATVSNSQFKVSGLTLPMAMNSGQSGTLTVSVTPTASGTVTGTLTVQGDAGSSPAVVNLTANAVTSNPQISLSSSAVSFGNVAVSSAGSSNVTVSNTGSADLTISAVTVAGTGFAFSGITTPKTISAGQSSAISLTFTPSAQGAATGTLSITSNDPNNGKVSVALSGTGTTAPTGNLQANQSSLSFGSVTTGSNLVKQVVFTNSGTAAVQISGVSVTGTGFTASGISVPMTLNASSQATLSVKFAPTATGSVSGSITVTSNAPGSPLTIPVSGTGTAAPIGNLQANQSSLSFGSVTTGTNLVKQVVLTNSGTAAVQISAVAATGTGFTVSGISVPMTLNPSSQATLSVTFAPTTTGNASGSVTITSNAPGSPLTIPVSGTGAAAPIGNLQANQSSLAFGNVGTGANSVKQVVLTNSGTAAVQISAVAATGTGFTVSGVTTPLTLNASSQATLSVTFAPTTAGNASGSITVTSNAPGSPLTIPISGTGVQPGLAVSPTSFSFGNVVDGQTSSHSFTVTNSGSASLTISQLSISAAGYTVNGLSVPSTVAPGASVTFNAVFAPTTAGSLSGTVNIASNAPNSPATVALSGTGVAATKTLSFSSSSISFGSVNTGTSVSQNETITNTGNSSVQISQIAASGTGYSLNGASAVTLNPSQTLTFSVIFDPSAAGSASGSVTVTSNAAGSPGTITLTGTGVQAVSHTVSLNWNASTSTVSGYNVYRSTTSGGGYVKVNASLVSGLSYTDASIQNSTTYFYVTTAVDSTGDESVFSNEASAVIP
jgi:hypothetical protein